MLSASEDIDTMFAEEFDAGLKGTAPNRTKLYRTCEENDVGITVMKGFADGRLFDEERCPFGVPSRSECRKLPNSLGAEKRLANEQAGLVCCAVYHKCYSSITKASEALKRLVHAHVFVYNAIRTAGGISLVRLTLKTR